MALDGKFRRRLESFWDESLRLSFNYHAFKRKNGSNYWFYDYGCYYSIKSKLTGGVIWSLQNASLEDWINSASRVHSLAEEYMNTPRSELLYKVFDNDVGGFCDILKAADRRLNPNKIMGYMLISVLSSSSPWNASLYLLNKRIELREQNKKKKKYGNSNS